MNIFMRQNQNHGHTEQTGGCQGAEGCRTDGVGLWDQQMQTSIYGTDKKQSPTVQQRDLYSIVYNKSQWEKTLKNICISETLCCKIVINTTL